jgi:hypothetical protein
MLVDILPCPCTAQRFYTQEGGRVKQQEQHVATYHTRTTRTTCLPADGVSTHHSLPPSMMMSPGSMYLHKKHYRFDTKRILCIFTTILTLFSNSPLVTAVDDDVSWLHVLAQEALQV